MKETADSTVPSSDLGAFERAASANDSTDTKTKFPYNIMEGNGIFEKGGWEPSKD